MPRSRPRYPAEYRKQMVDLSGPGGARNSSPASSRLQRSRSATGWPRRTVTKAVALRA
jgi:hypothetical protein